MDVDHNNGSNGQNLSQEHQTGTKCRADTEDLEQSNQNFRYGNRHRHPHWRRGNSSADARDQQGGLTAAYPRSRRTYYGQNHRRPYYPPRNNSGSFRSYNQRQRGYIPPSRRFVSNGHEESPVTPGKNRSVTLRVSNWGYSKASGNHDGGVQVLLDWLKRKAGDGRSRNVRVIAPGEMLVQIPQRAKGRYLRMDGLHWAGVSLDIKEHVDFSEKSEGLDYGCSSGGQGVDHGKLESPAKADSAPVVASAIKDAGEKGQLVMEIGKITGLTEKFAEIYLVESGMDLEKAKESFEANKAQLSTEAFLDPTMDELDMEWSVV
ncbi:hypothetical protein K470DRAFT_265583 [Piedraia hortae CBS 480.64]|uniref:TAP-C domain-containing protein n=1 Tax=Piedraia hortae CBS 480.64 TaxID=1314780 RepID=A0A6A7BV48_9PEZI|nr:hypothetical protein K470DRAFT_265583 [Piedraia hortae CBS 480.64]